jgi:hypothetical protein
MWWWWWWWWWVNINCQFAAAIVMPRCRQELPTSFPPPKALVCREQASKQPPTHKCLVWVCKISSTRVVVFYFILLYFIYSNFFQYLYIEFPKLLPLQSIGERPLSSPLVIVIPSAPFSAMITKLRIPILRSAQQAREDFSIYTFPEHQRLLLELVPSNMTEELLADGLACWAVCLIESTILGRLQS